MLLHSGQLANILHAFFYLFLHQICKGIIISRIFPRRKLKSKLFTYLAQGLIARIGLMLTESKVPAISHQRLSHGK